MSAPATAATLADVRIDGSTVPSWLVATREWAFGQLEVLGLPTQRHEDWKYLRLGPVRDVPFTASSATDHHEVTAQKLAAAVPDLGGVRLVFVNGHLSDELSTASNQESSPESGVTVTSLASLLASDPDRLKPFFADRSAPADGMAALHLGLADDGAFIHLAADARTDAPIHMVFVTTDVGRPVLSSPHSLIVAGTGSAATVVETHVGVGDLTHPTCTNGVTRIMLGERSTVHHHTVQDLPDAAFHFGVVDVVAGNDSACTAHTLSLGAAIARHEVRVHLDGNGAEATVTGLYQPAGNQFHDHPILVEHNAPNCTSRQMYNGVLDDHGHGVFNGRIMVAPAGMGTDATQSNRNLVLSDRAEVDTRPRLEILADDVKCAHGATVGQLDETAVHYLRTRGIPEAAARGMLTYAFATEMVDRIDVPALQSWVAPRVADRLGAVLGDDTAAADGVGSPIALEANP
jgi:Fe-S cluster assembly protein SufD